MAFAQRMEIRQGQSLVMTPQLQQAIKLLQLSNLELAAYVEAELEKNPLLERDERDDRTPAETVEAERDGADAKPAEDPFAAEAPSAEAARDLDCDYETLYTEDSGSDRAAPDPAMAGPVTDWSKARGGSFDDDGGFDAALSEAPNLRDHLSDQLGMATADPRTRMIGSFLIDMIDEAGYLRGDLETVSERMGCSPEEVERALTLVQSLEPTGVGARDLAECLSLQLAERDRLDPAMQCFLANIDMLAKHDLQGLMRVCEVDADDVADMISEIRELNPKPGLVFGSEPVQPVVPDVFVREKPEGGWHVEVNSDTLPRVLVNSRYHADVAASARSTDAKHYINECLANANWLVKSLDQRARTILKVATEIVRQQDAFLAKGVSHLRPLNLRMVAEAIGMHESTVSRVTSNKYMATPRGVFELKYFFTTAIGSTEGGDAHSAESVRHRIKGLIDEERPNAILSDDAIVDLLKKDGIDIARRTVAKYRESLRIPSSVQRRRMKKQSA